MLTEQSLSYFNYIRINDKEVFEKPETWKRGTRIYMNLLERYPDQKWFWSWNWAAAIFQVFWMIYRRMYVEGILLLIFCEILSAGHDEFVSLYGLDVLWSDILFISFSIVAFGLFGTPYYLQAIRRDTVAWKTRKKNTDWFATVLSIILFIRLTGIVEEATFERIIGIIVLGAAIMVSSIL